VIVILYDVPGRFAGICRFTEKLFRVRLENSSYLPEVKQFFQDLFPIDLRAAAHCLWSFPSPFPSPSNRALLFKLFQFVQNEENSEVYCEHNRLFSAFMGIISGLDALASEGKGDEIPSALKRQVATLPNHRSVASEFLMRSIYGITISEDAESYDYLDDEEFECLDKLLKFHLSQIEPSMLAKMSKVIEGSYLLVFPLYYLMSNLHDLTPAYKSSEANALDPLFLLGKNRYYWMPENRSRTVTSGIYNYNLKSDIPVVQSQGAPPDWTKRVWEVLRAPGVSSTEIIQVLSEHPKLRECFAMDSGNGFEECKTIGKHTQRVVDNALKFRAGLEENVCKLVLWEEFLLFLALHDIGKGIAVEKDRNFPAPTPMRCKEAELVISQDILGQVMSTLDIPAEKVNIFKQLLAYDLQGPFLLYAIDTDEMFDKFTEMAHRCGVDPTALFRLYQAYHKVDAASYPNLRGDFQYSATSIDYFSMYQDRNEQLEAVFRQAAQGEKIFRSLLQRGNISQEGELIDFQADLCRFLDKKHKEMLLSPENKQEFRQIKREFKSLCANHRLPGLEDKLVQFRKDYLCRFSIDKVASGIQKEIDPKVRPLMNITFLHCTTADILKALDRSGMELLPKAMLLDAKNSGAIDPSVVSLLEIPSPDQNLIPGASLEEVMAVYQKAQANRTFPIVLASSSLHTKKLGDARCAQRSIQLGKDIQWIFVDRQNRSQVEAFFRERGVAVEVEDIELLAAASANSQLAASHFALRKKWPEHKPKQTEAIEQRSIDGTQKQDWTNVVLLSMLVAIVGIGLIRNYNHSI